MPVETAVIRTDVTAVKLYEEYVFAGIGGYVHIFRKKNNQLISKLRVLDAQKIYGFTPSKKRKQIIVYGGKQFAVIEEDCGLVGKYTIMCKPVLCDDWLHSAVWFNDKDVAILTAHNVVQIWDCFAGIMKSSHASQDNSILYSGLLLPITAADIVVFAGTVFSDVIIHCYGDNDPLHHLKGHRGVIFSIACDSQNEIIVTTSDDRSVRIWGPKAKVDHSFYTKQYWENVIFDCRREIYGHTARVMRSIVVNNLIASVGEDSAICYWDVDGNLIKKRQSHQNASIWSLDADRDSLVTGGGDGAVIMHPLAAAKDTQIEHLNLDEIPKKIAFTARNNLIILDDDFRVIYYDSELKTLKTIEELGYKPSTQSFLSLSSCKQFIAIASMMGNLNIFTENCKGEPSLNSFIKTNLDIGRILSMHWAGNRHLLFCSEQGKVTVFASKGMEMQALHEFILPNCKERWLTAAAFDPNGQVFVLGDRCGHIHVYKPDKAQPFRTFHKVHGRYGPTSIKIRDNEIVTTGRSGSIKTFAICENNVTFMNSTELNFQWVEKFLDRDENFVCGFHETDFVVYDKRNGNKVLEITCGGGHRSWDATRYIEINSTSSEEYISLAYLKDTDVNIATFQLSKLVSMNIVDGTHTKVINCLTTYKHRDWTYFFSGGEDNTLRIQLYSEHPDTCTLKELAIFRHVSSIRTLKVLKVCDDKALLVSAGGRAQICIKLVQFTSKNDSIKVHTILDHMIKGSDKERKVNKNWRNKEVDFDPETRIMDLDVIHDKENEFTIVAGCSDACLRVFHLQLSTNSTLELVNEIRYHPTCILKCKHFTHGDRGYILTCTTRGDLALWKTEDLQTATAPMLTTKTNKSGINSVAVECGAEGFRIATGGDDNDVHIVRVDQRGVVCGDSREPPRHSSQVTGVLWRESELISCSIDQRLSAGAQWTHATDVADVQGMAAFDTYRLCVFGKGLEIFNLRRS